MEGQQTGAWQKNSKRVVSYPAKKTLKNFTGDHTDREVGHSLDLFLEFADRFVKWVSIPEKGIWLQHDAQKVMPTMDSALVQLLASSKIVFLLWLAGREVSDGLQQFVLDFGNDICLPLWWQLCFKEFSCPALPVLAPPWASVPVLHTTVKPLSSILTADLVKSDF